MRVICALAVLLISTTYLLADDSPQADVALSYSHVEVLKGYTISMNGGTGSGSYNLNHWVGVAADFGGYHGYPSQSLTGETFALGPRFTYRRFQLLQPFAQGLFGGSHFNVSSGGITGGGLPLAFAGGAGVDIAPGHSRKLAMRLQRDYFTVRSGGGNTVCDRLSAGLVFRFGQK